ELRWQQSFADAAVRRAAGHGWIERANGHLLLTDDGRQIAQQVTGRVHA
ncbi:MAG: metal ABC transporter permease, partial [Burkholderiales bacterium]|nr:metal ABC transporter permease [Anaerolineae bacterium]